MISEYFSFYFCEPLTGRAQRSNHPACSMLKGVTNSYGWEMAMGNERKQQDEPEREQPQRQHEEEKPQTWKHPDDGTELSERDQEFPLKP
jgi:hypothetical protein